LSKDRPIILQVIPQLDTGGAERTVVEVSDAVVRAGGRALVLCQSGRLIGEAREAGAEIIEFPAKTKNPARILWNAQRIAALVEREHVDVVHARSRAPAWSAFLAARRTGVAFVTTYHGAYAEKGRAKSLYNSVMARSDVVIANSRYTADLIRQRYATPETRIRVIYRGIDADRFDATRIEPERIAALRTQWGVPPRARVILHVARLTSWKGQSVVIGAMAQLIQQSEHGGKMDDVHVVLAGDAQGRDGYVGELRRLIEAVGLQGRVHLVGHVEDVPAAYLAAHVTVVASTEPEAFGRAAVEAQAMGCPVIATRIGAPPETVKAEPAFARSEMTGWLVEPGSLTELASALSDALDLDDGGRAGLGARARRHAHGAFSLDSLKRDTLAVYDGLIGSRLADTFEADRRRRLV
jgi:glycosyltransferase involved in cell wall biosynthesis